MCYNWSASSLRASGLLHLLDKIEQVVSEQLGLFKGCKVATPGHESVGLDVSVPNLCP